MKTSHPEISREITAAEVKEWFGGSKISTIGGDQCRKIATGLTKLRWPGDPPPPPRSRGISKESEPDPHLWWDFDAVAEAAMTLLKNCPAMLSHWEGQRWAPQTCDGFDVIKRLGDALLFAMPYIEWPLGYYKRKKWTGSKRPKPWHPTALAIATVTIRVIVKAGNRKPGITRNSIVVRIVHNTLRKMNVQDVEMISHSAIAAHLTRWDKKFGLTPNKIAVLTTKHAAEVCDQDLPNVGDYPPSLGIDAWRRKWLRQVENAQQDNRTQRKSR
jgi:hypothetical protein